MLALAGLSAAICFVGFMMLVASLGKTEQTASGAGWAILMPLSMFGGAMVPTFVMPRGSSRSASSARSAGRCWRSKAACGATSRSREMVTPCAILITIGIACFASARADYREA